MFKIIRSKSNEKHDHSQETIDNEMIIDEQKKNDQDTHKLENYKHNKSENIIKTATTWLIKRVLVKVGSNLILCTSLRSMMILLLWTFTISSDFMESQFVFCFIFVIPLIFAENKTDGFKLRLFLKINLFIYF